MFRSIKNLFQREHEFTRRIKHRHRVFWMPENAESIRNEQMSADDPLEKWMDVENWQRRLSNKYNAKLFAQKMGCKVAKLYWKGLNPEEINFDVLPEAYVIRPTVGHSSGNVFLMNNGVNLFDNKLYSSEELSGHMISRLQEKVHLEFMIEEFLQELPGTYKILNDYKFFCFNGEIASCQLINRRGPKAGFGSFYNDRWEPMAAVHPGYTLVEPHPVPDCFEEMVAQVKVLSRAYRIFCRIDFYATVNGAVFGEFTPTPGLGRGYSAFGQRLLVSFWDKYCAGLV